MKNFILFCCIVATAVAFPAPQGLPTPVLQSNVRNVIDVPIVCPPNQKPDHNGRCREVWRIARLTKYIVCPNGQIPNLRGLRCDPIDTDKNVIDVPVVCPVGQKPDQNGKCREVWTLSDVDDRNVIDVPVVCPVGQKPDQNGKCRDVYTARSGVDTQNVIDVPVVCPPNQKPDQNGKCREQWNIFGIEVVPGLEID
ncbi:uncharacterized protein LOC119085852 isoform X2 [Bradysia coprophila]|uniref:uncharacterized protein LOC119085852 isoform X2 n=1 Tax=Bradysia coprophila TaxID=38358 RepID=UPI00187DC4B9|nr:uncharacterized protein LOC119085852 isoform X2 [Bradysia coprophila]